MKHARLFTRLIALVAFSAAAAYAVDLTFLTDATNPANGKSYKAYIDKSTIYKEGDYQTVKLISIYETPISGAGYDGIKSMVNTFQIDCGRHVKRVTYIAFLDSDGKVIVDEKDPDAKDEGIGQNTVDSKVVPYLCPE